MTMPALKLMPQAVAPTMVTGRLSTSSSRTADGASLPKSLGWPIGGLAKASARKGVVARSTTWRRDMMPKTMSKPAPSQSQSVALTASAGVP